MLPLLAIGGLAVVLLALSVGSDRRANAPRTEGGPLTSHGSSKTLVIWTLENDRVKTPPAQILAAAQKKAGFTFPMRAFLLATMAASEYGNDSPAILLAGVMHAALNYERKFRSKTGGKTNLEMMLLGSVTGTAPNQFGGQRGRYASTANPPTAASVKLALDVLAGKVKDPTGGAVQFDAPKTQAILNRQRPKTAADPGGFSTPAVIAQERMAGGRKVSYIPGVDPQLARFWV